MSNEMDTGRQPDDVSGRPPKVDECSPPTIRRVLVTGGEGIIGGVVRRNLADGFDLAFLTRYPTSFASRVGDIASLASIEPAFDGVDAVVHLAAASSVDAPWGDVLAANIEGTRNVFEAARANGVRRVVFASSNHVVGMYEAESAPAIYGLDDPRFLNGDTPARPDSLYGVSKVFGEALARFYADRHGMDVVCLRIGTVLADDDPTHPSAGRPFTAFPEFSEEEARIRLRATWLSHRDCGRLVQAALEAPVHWAVVYGTSANPRRLWDLEPARDLLGYVPIDAAPI